MYLSCALVEATSDPCNLEEECSAFLDWRKPLVQVFLFTARLFSISHNGWYFCLPLPITLSTTSKLLHPCRPHRHQNVRMVISHRLGYILWVEPVSIRTSNQLSTVMSHYSSAVHSRLSLLLRISLSCLYI